MSPLLGPAFSALAGTAPGHGADRRTNEPRLERRFDPGDDGQGDAGIMLGEKMRDAVAVAIEAAFAAGDEVSGYARQWASSYGVLASWLEADPELANQVLLLPHERLCADPAATLRQLGEHCRIGQGRLQNWLASWQHRIQARPELTLESLPLQTVAQHCGAVARRLGYGSITGALA